ncbi:hypothetical protein SAMN04488122_3903 [Chitinophaga arvensicola]|uniref:Uncharacterized protein n=1 Tax=Chitinophaga arvensicola TaxID=29529 RepID=A0A1I0S6B1_9BACT|nr:hypothetical protein SAMN04488122_3903 [Chitinophaga arvensicola]
MDKIKEFLATTPGKVSAALAAVLVIVYFIRKNKRR